MTTFLDPATVHELGVKWGHALNKTYRPSYESSACDYDTAIRIVEDVLREVERTMEVPALTEERSDTLKKRVLHLVNSTHLAHNTLCSPGPLPLVLVKSFASALRANATQVLDFPITGLDELDTYVVVEKRGRDAYGVELSSQNGSRT